MTTKSKILIAQALALFRRRHPYGTIAVEQEVAQAVADTAHQLDLNNSKTRARARAAVLAQVMP